MTLGSSSCWLDSKFCFGLVCTDIDCSNDFAFISPWPKEYIVCVIHVLFRVWSVRLWIGLCSVWAPWRVIVWWYRVLERLDLALEKYHLVGHVFWISVSAHMHRLGSWSISYGLFSMSSYLRHDSSMRITRVWFVVMRGVLCMQGFMLRNFDGYYAATTHVSLLCQWEVKTYSTNEIISSISIDIIHDRYMCVDNGT